MFPPIPDPGSGAASTLGNSHKNRIPPWRHNSLAGFPSPAEALAWAWAYLSAWACSSARLSASAYLSAWTYPSAWAYPSCRLGRPRRSGRICRLGRTRRRVCRRRRYISRNNRLIASRLSVFFRRDYAVQHVSDIFHDGFVHDNARVKLRARVFKRVISVAARRAEIIRHNGVNVIRLKFFPVNRRDCHALNRFGAVIRRIGIDVALIVRFRRIQRKFNAIRLRIAAQRRRRGVSGRFQRFQKLRARDVNHRHRIAKRQDCI